MQICWMWRPTRHGLRARSAAGPLIAFAILAAMAACAQAGAEVLSFEDFARLFGETAEARSACRSTIDQPVLDAIGLPFQDALDADVAAEKLAKARADAGARHERMGDAAYCAEMLKRYGPDGEVAKGLLKP